MRDYSAQFLCLDRYIISQYMHIFVFIDICHSGVNDTIIDEAVYSKNHLIRAPGCCKVGTGALKPVKLDKNNTLDLCWINSGETSSQIVLTRESEKIFQYPNNDEGYNQWRGDLIQPSVHSSMISHGADCIMVVGIVPTSSYPSKRAWSKAANDRAVNIQDLIAQNRASIIDFTQVRYEEMRPTKANSWDRITNINAKLLWRTPKMLLHDDYEYVSIDDVFMGEDNCEKKFIEFEPGDKLVRSILHTSCFRLFSNFIL